MTAIRVLAIGDENPYHDFPLAADAIEAGLPDGVEVDRTMEPARLTDLEGYDAVLDYVTISDHAPDEREGLTSFVADGGGYVGVHCASDLTTGVEEVDPALRELIGGQFVDHPEQATFPVRTFQHVHPVAAGVEDFTVHDEPYRVEHDDDVTVFARMDHPENGDVPVAWAKPYGDGRSVYCSLGHDASALTAPGTRRLLTRGLRWSVGQIG
jgi:hypothetical protein